jgi:hypothetical protein
MDGVFIQDLTGASTFIQDLTGASTFNVEPLLFFLFSEVDGWL